MQKTSQHNGKFQMIYPASLFRDQVRTVLWEYVREESCRCERESDFCATIKFYKSHKVPISLVTMWKISEIYPWKKPWHAWEKRVTFYEMPNMLDIRFCLFCELRQHLPRVGSGQPAGHGRPGQFARGGVLGCKRGAGGSRGRHVEGRGGGLGGSSGEKIGETAAKPGTPQLPRTIQRCCPNISRSLQMTFAWLTVCVLDNVAVQTPWEAEMYTIMGND